MIKQSSLDLRYRDEVAAFEASGAVAFSPYLRFEDSISSRLEY
jgi:hypothetical protein